jgi:hypothetical protein
MKNLLIIITSISMTLTSFTTVSNVSRVNGITSSEQLGERIVAALQSESPSEYIRLFPSLGEFHELMNSNADAYGPYLAEAKMDFDKEYNDALIPAVKKSFREILQSGREKGIVWSEIKFQSADFKLENKHGLTVPGIISFSYKGKVHQLRLEKAIVLQNNWKVGQYLQLV